MNQIGLTVVIAVVLVGSILFQTVASANTSERLLSVGDLYYFDKNGAKTPLGVATKVAVRVRKDRDPLASHDDTKKAQLAIVQGLSDEFSGIGVREASNSPLGDIHMLEFLPHTSMGRLLEIVHSIAARDGIAATQDFLVENREAVVSGMIVEPQNSLALAKGILAVLNRWYNPANLQESVLRYDWNVIAAEYILAAGGEKGDTPLE